MSKLVSRGRLYDWQTNLFFDVTRHITGTPGRYYLSQDVKYSKYRGAAPGEEYFKYLFPGVMSLNKKLDSISDSEIDEIKKKYFEKFTVTNDMVASDEMAVGKNERERMNSKIRFSEKELKKKTLEFQLMRYQPTRDMQDFMDKVYYHQMKGKNLKSFRGDEKDNPNYVPVEYKIGDRVVKWMKPKSEFRDRMNARAQFNPDPTKKIFDDEGMTNEQYALYLIDKEDNKDKYKLESKNKRAAQKKARFIKINSRRRKKNARRIHFLKNGKSRFSRRL